MKTILSIVVLSAAICCTKAQESASFTSPEINAQEYITLLKSGTYKEQYLLLPEFSPEQIPELLTFVDDNTVITGFPSNPLSSYAQNECKLGIYVLWTIESIRMAHQTDKYNFPSQNPCWQSKEAVPFRKIDDEKSHALVAHHYREWWEGSAAHDFEQGKQKDPLAELPIRWH